MRSMIAVVMLVGSCAHLSAQAFAAERERLYSSKIIAGASTDGCKMVKKYSSACRDQTGGCRLWELCPNQAPRPLECVPPPC